MAEWRLTFEQVQSGSGMGVDSHRAPLSAFAKEGFLLLKKGSDTYRRVLKLCRNAGFTPKVNMYLDQMLTAYHVAENGHGLTFVRPRVLDLSLIHIWFLPRAPLPSTMPPPSPASGSTGGWP